MITITSGGSSVIWEGGHGERFREAKPSPKARITSEGVWGESPTHFVCENYVQTQFVVNNTAKLAKH